MQQTVPGNYRVGADSTLLWTIACALTPVLMGIAGIAFYEDLLSTDPHATLLRNVRFATFLGAPLLCVGLQWYALRRFAPDLALWKWAGAAVVTLVLSFLFPHLIRPAEADFSLALYHWRSSDAVSTSLVGNVVMTFAKAIGLAVAFAFGASLLQTLVMRSATRLPWTIFLLAALAGAGAEAMIAHLPDFLGIYRWGMLNDLGWSHLLVELALRACAGAGYGIASSWVVFRILVPAAARTASASRHVGVILSFATVAVVAIPTSFAISDRGGGVSAAFIALKAFTTAPAQDISHGEAILQYSHLIDIRPGRYPVPSWSPDSRYVIFRDRQRRQMLVEIATGRQLGQLAEALSDHERSALAWSPDSRAVVIRTQGATDPIPDSKYMRNRIRLRTFSIPARELLGEYQTGPGECYESFAQVSLIYAPDGSSLWTHCDSRQPLQPESTMALQLDPNLLRPLRRKSYGTASVAGEVRTLGISNGEVVYLQRRKDRDVEEVRLGRLRDDTSIFRIDNLNAAGLTSGLLAQAETIKEGRIFADYCGEPAVKGAIDRKSICRFLEVDATTGEIIRMSDDADRRFEPHRQVVSTHDGLKVEGRQQPASKAAEMRVIDERTSQVRQRIETREQRPLCFSPDKHWLITHVTGTNRLSVYRVAR